MTDLHTAAKQALDYIVATNHSSTFWSVPESNLNKTVTALRQALANEALDRMAENARELGLDYGPAQTDWEAVAAGQAMTIALLKAEQPAQQEPVGEITAEDMGRPFNAIRINTHFYKEIPPVGTKLYTRPQAREPLLREIAALSANALDDYKMIQKLMAERQPLTDEQIEKLREKTFSTGNPYCPVDSKSMRKAARAIEAAHGIGENT